jgi:hypothetical protein
MNKTTLNFWMDVLLFLNFLALSITGAILKWGVPRGRDQEKFYGGLHRHDWQDWHFWLAVVIAVNVALHLILHWNWIVCQLRCRLSGKKPPASCPD